ncbi:hypothetical protein KHO49_17820 [Pseudomonas sp. RC4D1]|uniref:hypothetical protein n=1 Tax=Pseudomonas sp. RC4D1 TaxID=2834407 RepID=UPI001BCDB7FA|nr:hypothetical protein [Pseudomonas sp. RC4D1]MBS7560153.1 hypothetical protein [Pseudomonas sp. RC4D1]MBS7560198.1 hypothetical protein [Pseudomonas sp. RC4D1]
MQTQITVSYLFRLIQKAVHGDFPNQAAQKTKPPRTVPPVEVPSASTPADPKVANEHIAQRCTFKGLA